MTCNMNYNSEIDNSNRPWFKSVWERYIIPITTGTLVAVITLISSPGCVKRASSSLEKKLEEPGPTKSENPDSLKKAVLYSVASYLAKIKHDTTYAAAVREQPGLREVTYYWFGKYSEEKERIEKIADSLYIPEGVTLPETKEELLKRVGLGDIIGKWRDVRYKFIVIEPYAPYWESQMIFQGGRLRTEVDKSILRNWLHPEWTALYVAEVRYKPEGAFLGSLHEIGDTLIVTKGKVIDEVVKEILDKYRPPYHLIKDGFEAYDEYGNRDIYRFFVVYSEDDSAQAAIDINLPSTRGLLSELEKAAADTIISRYEAKHPELKQKRKKTKSPIPMHKW